MAENSKIEWTDHTFNPWIGCTKVAEGCKHCYAEAFAKRTGGAKWGDAGTRILTSPANWSKPLKWDREAAAAGKRARVFCASLADVFEDWQGPVLDHKGREQYLCPRCCANNHIEQDGHGFLEQGTVDGVTQYMCESCVTVLKVGKANDLRFARASLFRLIQATPNLDWLLLTKRPEHIKNYWPYQWDSDTVSWFTPRFENIWLGTSVANQKDANTNVPYLLDCRDISPVLFLSMEPLTGPISFRWASWQPLSNVPGGVTDELDGLRKLDWIIAGGESGPGSRPMHPDWVRQIRDECKQANVPFLFKQWGHWSWHQVLRNEAGEINLKPGMPVDALSKLHHWDGTNAVPIDKTKSTKEIFQHGEYYLSPLGKTETGRHLDGTLHDGAPA